MRTHKNNELNKDSIGEKVKLVGWVHTRRDHGGIIFVDLRDRYGITQVVFDPEFNSNVMESAESLRREFCIEVHGEVKARKEGMTNEKLTTGEIEVFVDTLNIINKAEVPPIEVDDRIEAGEELRLKYRYLDLRRPLMQKRLAMRHKVTQAVRNFLSKNDFLEIETPLLIRATPEGARDYIVPSRVHPGKFFSLPQSPQLYKQILMVSGMDRYFQLARCLRDEDLRSDRQPEFTQIDMEMSFVSEEDIHNICEGLMKSIWKEALNIDLKTPFPKLTYKEAMDKYGIDKPDIRFDLFLTDVTEIVIKSDFGVFKDVKTNGGIVKCINPNKDLGRKEIDTYIEYCQELGAKGMAWMRVTENGLESNIAKYFSEDVQKELIDKVGAKPGSVLMFIADKPDKCNDILARFRNKLGKDLEIYNPEDFAFCWVTRFPVFEYNEDEKRWSPMHHIFSMPQEDCLDFLETDPGKVTGKLYDLALNGVELGGGSIRIHKKELQERVLKVIGMTYEEAEARFGFLLNAFKYGAPPHGGIAFGLDRVCALLNGINDIREVIAFPKNKAAECPMDGSPSTIDDAQFKEAHIEPDAVAKEALKKKADKDSSNN